MKQVITFAFALMIATVAFGQKKAANNPLVSEQNYKHPFAATTAKNNKLGKSETLATENVVDAQDYKHMHNRKSVRRVRLPQGDGSSPAASQKHPLGL
ncbi:MAG TPA: hypothetical protein VK508_05930 [Cyclobacteriaceae bacterium]|nr:hypothetical protein [Cyclobacteriaceae bacterium]